MYIMATGVLKPVYLKIYDEVQGSNPVIDYELHESSWTAQVKSRALTDIEVSEEFM